MFNACEEGVVREEDLYASFRITRLKQLFNLTCKTKSTALRSVCPELFEIFAMADEDMRVDMF